ncbi:MAG: hypothetical protein U1F53_14270 [Burkholderiaceae bacterium]
MRKTFFVALALSVVGQLANAAGELKAVSCLYELQAETYRFARLQLENSTAANQDLKGKLRTQIKSATQELFLNLHEAKPGLGDAGMQRQYQRLDDQVADYVAEAVSITNVKGLAPLRNKQAALLKSLDETARQLVQKVPGAAGAGVVLIGSAKTNVERLAHDFEFCDTNCAQVLPPEVVTIDKNIDDMRNSLGKYFSKSSYDLAKNQIVFLRMAVDSRARGSASELAQSNVIVTSTHLWEVIDEVLDAFTEKGGN